MELDEQKKKKLLEYLSKVELDKLLPFFELLEEIRDQLKNISRPDRMMIELPGVELLTIKGKDGKDGRDGKDGVNGKNGKDGKDGLDGLDGKDGKDGVDGKDGKDGKDAEPLGKLEIEIENVNGLEKELKEIRNLPSGGGTSALAVRQAMKYIFHTETPVGVIDGVNTTYTVNNPIFAISCFMLNGEVIALSNYTVSNRTITFSTPLPSAYSGKDFEIKYFG